MPDECEENDRRKLSLRMRPLLKALCQTNAEKGPGESGRTVTNLELQDQGQKRKTMNTEIQRGSGITKPLMSSTMPVEYEENDRRKLCLQMRPLLKALSNKRQEGARRIRQNCHKSDTLGPRSDEEDNEHRNSERLGDHRAPS